MLKIKNSCNMENKMQKQKEKARRSKKFAVGMAFIGAMAVTVGVMLGGKKRMEMRSMCKRKALDSVEKTKDIIQKKADNVHDTAEHAAKAADEVISNIDKKADELHENIIHGYHDVKNDISKTVEDISSDLKKAER